MFSFEINISYINNLLVKVAVENAFHINVALQSRVIASTSAGTTPLETAWCLYSRRLYPLHAHI